ncbi:hypothetical protein PVAP13_4NG164299 [Panicum virgatum]|uniref:Uncharacterized protein n=1 Tax=Panicum virgatum TaxID=38727 RepID=A0A8T0TC88_PANVG|nr:hypothetical protein PVAP13_4NG164299 [Panicum virgatum]
MRCSYEALPNSDHGSTYGNVGRLANAKQKNLVCCLHCDRSRRQFIIYSLTVYLLDNFGSLLKRYGQQALSHSMEDASFENWWFRTSETINGQLQGVNLSLFLASYQKWQVSYCLPKRRHNFVPWLSRKGFAT